MADARSYLVLDLRQPSGLLASRALVVEEPQLNHPLIHQIADRDPEQSNASMLERDLDASLFFRSHRNALVNTANISRLILGKNYTYNIEFPNGLKVKLTRKRVVDFKYRLGYKV